MAKSKDAIGILFGVLGGGDVNGESYKRINEELDQLVKNINHHAPKAIQLTIDTDDFQRKLTDLFNSFSKQKLTIDASKIKVDTTAAAQVIAESVEESVAKAVEKGAEKAQDKVAEAVEKGEAKAKRKRSSRKGSGSPADNATKEVIAAEKTSESAAAISDAAEKLENAAKKVEKALASSTGKSGSKVSGGAAVQLSSYLDSYAFALGRLRDGQKRLKGKKKTLRVDDSGNFYTDNDYVRGLLSEVNSSHASYTYGLKSAITSKSISNEDVAILSARAKQIEEELLAGLQKASKHTTPKAENRIQQQGEAARQAADAINDYIDVLNRANEASVDGVSIGRGEDKKFFAISETEQAIALADELNKKYENIAASMKNRHLTKAGKATAISFRAGEIETLTKGLSLGGTRNEVQEKLTQAKELYVQAVEFQKVIEDEAASGRGGAEHAADTISEYVGKLNSALEMIENIQSSLPDEILRQNSGFFGNVRQLRGRAFESEAEEQARKLAAEAQEFVRDMVSGYRQTFNQIAHRTKGKNLPGGKEDALKWVMDNAYDTANGIGEQYGTVAMLSFVKQLGKTYHISFDDTRLTGINPKTPEEKRLVEYAKDYIPMHLSAAKDKKGNIIPLPESERDYYTSLHASQDVTRKNLEAWREQNPDRYDSHVGALYYTEQTTQEVADRIQAVVDKLTKNEIDGFTKEQNELIAKINDQFANEFQSTRDSYVLKRREVNQAAFLAQQGVFGEIDAREASILGEQRRRQSNAYKTYQKNRFAVGDKLRSGEYNAEEAQTELDAIQQKYEESIGQIKADAEAKLAELKAEEKKSLAEIETQRNVDLQRLNEEQDAAFGDIETRRGEAIRAAIKQQAEAHEEAAEKIVESEQVIAEVNEQSAEVAEESVEASKEAAEEKKEAAEEEAESEEDILKRSINELKKFYAERAKIAKLAAKDGLLVETNPDDPTDRSSLHGLSTYSYAGDAVNNPYAARLNYFNQLAQGAQVAAEAIKSLNGSAKEAAGEYIQEANEALAASNEKLLDDTTTKWSKNKSKIHNRLIADFEAIQRDPRLKALAQEIQDMLNVDNPKNLETVTAKFKELTDTMGRHGSDIPNFFLKLEKAMKTAVVSFVTMSITRYVRDIYNEVKTVDTALNKLQIVTNSNADAMQRFGNVAAESAKKIGVSLSSIIDATTTYAKLGFTLEEASKLAEVTSSFARVSGVSVDETTRNVTGIVKAYKVSTNELETVADKLVYVGNNFAISQYEIGQGMNNAASSLQANGNSFDQALALLTAANTTVQDIDRASTAMRTITARLAASKSELDKLGEDSTGVSTTAKLAEEFAAYGITITDGNNNLKSTYDILAQIAAKWQYLNDEQKNAIAMISAGTRQQDIFFSIINNFAEAEKLVGNIDESAGALGKATEIRLNSIQGQLDILTATLEKMSTDILDSGLVVGATRFINFLVKGIDKIVTAGGGFVLKSSAWIAGITMASKAIKALPTSNIGLFTKNIIDLIVAARNGISPVQNFGEALQFLNINPVVLGLSAAAVALVAFNYAMEAPMRKMKKLQEAIDSNTAKISEFTSQLSKIDSDLESTASRYDELIKATENRTPTFVESAEMKKIEDTTTKLKALRLEYEELKKHEEDEKRKNSLEYLQSSLNGTSSYYGKIAAGNVHAGFWEQLGSKLKFNASHAGIDTSESGLNRKYTVSGTLTEVVSSMLDSVIAGEYDSLLDEEKQFVASAYDDIKDHIDDLVYYTGEALTGEQKKANKTYLDAKQLVQKYYLANGMGTSFLSNVVAMEMFDGVDKAMQKALEGVDVRNKMDVDEALRGLYDTSELFHQFYNYISEIGYSGGVQSLAEFIADLASDATNGGVSQTTFALKSFLDVLSEIKNEYDALTTAQSDMESYGILTVSTVEKLLDPEKGFPGLEKYLTLTARGYTLAEDALESYLNEEQARYELAVKQARSDEELSRARENLSTFLSVRNSLGVDKAIKKETADLKKQDDAYKDIIDSRKKMLETYKDEIDYQQKLLKKQKDIAKLEAQLTVAKMDKSAAGRARVRDLQDQLDDERDSLNEYTLEYAVKQVSSGLDDQYKEYKKFIDEHLENIQKGITSIAESVWLTSDRSFGGLSSINNSLFRPVNMTINVDNLTSDALPRFEKIVDEAVDRVIEKQQSALSRTGAYRPAFTIPLK